MTFSTTQSLDQRPLAPPMLRKVPSSQVSSLAAGQGQIMTAKSYPWDIESFLRPAQGRHIQPRRWVANTTGAYSGAMNLKLRSTTDHLTNLFGAVKHSPVNAPHMTREIVSYNQAIMQALDSEQILTARNILAALPTHLAGEPGFRGLGRVLALPVIHISSKHDTDRSFEFNWLRTNGHKYRGQWVAIEGENLLATALTLRSLRDQLRNEYPYRSPLIHRVV